MGLISGLFKTAINMATLPVDVIKDAVDIAIGNDNTYKKSSIDKKFDKIQDDIEEMFE